MREIDTHNPHFQPRQKARRRLNPNVAMVAGMLLLYAALWLAARWYL